MGLCTGAYTDCIVRGAEMAQEQSAALKGARQHWAEGEAHTREGVFLGLCQKDVLRVQQGAQVPHRPLQQPRKLMIELPVNGIPCRSWNFLWTLRRQMNSG